MKTNLPSATDPSTTSLHFFTSTLTQSIMTMNPQRIKAITPILLGLFIIPVLGAQTTFTWNGDTSGLWTEASNWDPDTGVPTSADTVVFSNPSASTAIDLDAPATIALLQFSDGADAYTFSGETLTIERGSSAFINHSAGNVQVFQNNVTLSSTSINSRSIVVAAGSELVFEGELRAANAGAKDTNIALSGGGTLTLTSTSVLANVNAFTATGAGTTLNYNGNASRPWSLAASNGGTINVFRTGFTGSWILSGTGDSTINIKVAGNTVSASGSNNTRIGPNKDGTATISAAIDGGGTATLVGSRAILLNYNDNTGTQTNTTVRFDAQAGNTLNVESTISDRYATIASGARVLITGDGVVRYGGTAANTSLIPIEIDGTLELAKTAGVDAIAAGRVTVNKDGTLRLASSNQIADATELILAGGTFSVAGDFSESLGNLSIGADGGTIDLSGQVGGSLTFAGLSSIVGTLTISGWSEGSSIFFTDGSAWDETALGLVNFEGYGAAAFDIGTGALYAIPEPAAAALLFAIASVGAVLWYRRRDAV